MTEVEVALTQQAETSVEDDEWRANMPLITKPCEAEHDDSSKHVWRSDQALRCTDTETHAFVQNDGKKVCNCISAGCCEAEERSESPHLEVGGVCEIFSDMDSVQVSCCLTTGI